MTPLGLAFIGLAIGPCLALLIGRALPPRENNVRGGVPLPCLAGQHPHQHPHRNGAEGANGVGVDQVHGDRNHISLERNLG